MCKFRGKFCVYAEEKLRNCSLFTFTLIGNFQAIYEKTKFYYSLTRLENLKLFFVYSRKIINHALPAFNLHSVCFQPFFVFRIRRVKNRRVEL